MISKMDLICCLFLILFPGIFILYYFVLYTNDEFSIQLGIGGIGVTIIVAIMIFTVQAWMSQQVTEMSSEYTKRRRDRIKSFKDETIEQLNRVKKRDEKFLSLMTEYSNNRSMENRKKVEEYANSEQTKNSVNVSKFLIQKRLEYSRDFINKSDIITTLSTSLYDLGEEFSVIKYVNFDAFEKNTTSSKDFIEVNPILSISTDFQDHIDSVKFKIKEIDDLISLIQSEPE